MKNKLTPVEKAKGISKRVKVWTKLKSIWKYFVNSDCWKHHIKMCCGVHNLEVTAILRAEREVTRLTQRENER